MTKFVTDRSAITKQILGIIKPDYNHDDVNRAVKKWWANLRSTGGLRLTEAGYEAFTQAEIEAYLFQGKKLGLVEDFIALNTMYLKLDRRLPCPYYLGYPGPVLRLWVYDSRVGMMIELHGTLLDYLNTLEDRTQQETDND